MVVVVVVVVVVVCRVVVWCATSTPMEGEGGMEERRLCPCGHCYQHEVERCSRDYIQYKYPICDGTLEDHEVQK